MPFLLLMPSYNQAHYIGEAVDSCLAQDDPDWELWILDNSTDGTPEVMKAYSDPRIHFIHEPRRMDPGSCLNILLEKAKGDFFSYIHTDNRLSPGFVRRHRSALSAHPMALAYCNYWEMDAEGTKPRLRSRPKVFPSDRLFSSDSIGVPFAATTALARAIGGFTSDDLADDVFFVVRADGIGPRIHISEPLVEYRVHGNSRTEIWGVQRVRQAIYRSALQAYRVRSTSLPDPYEGTVPRILAHVDQAARMAQILARHLLRKVPSDLPIWIEGVDPASFWLAWACADIGRQPAGFQAKAPGTLLGLPVEPHNGPVPPDLLCLRPRRRGLFTGSKGPHWSLPLLRLFHGLPPLDHAIKRYPANLMSSLLIPLHSRLPEGQTQVWVEGEGPLAAYLAYGAETLAGLTVAGWVGSAASRLGPRQALPGPPDEQVVWATPSRPPSRKS